MKAIWYYGCTSQKLLTFLLYAKNEAILSLYGANSAKFKSEIIKHILMYLYLHQYVPE